MGIQTVLDTVNLNQLLYDAGIVFSGEGKIDTQSIRCKAVIGKAVFSIIGVAVDFEVAK